MFVDVLFRLTNVQVHHLSNVCQHGPSNLPGFASAYCQAWKTQSLWVWGKKTSTEILVTYGKTIWSFFIAVCLCFWSGVLLWIFFLFNESSVRLTAGCQSHPMSVSVVVCCLCLCRYGLSPVVWGPVCAPLDGVDGVNQTVTCVRDFSVNLDIKFSLSFFSLHRPERQFVVEALSKVSSMYTLSTLEENELVALSGFTLYFKYLALKLRSNKEHTWSGLSFILFCPDELSYRLHCWCHRHTCCHQFLFWFIETCRQCRQSFVFDVRAARVWQISKLLTRLLID